MLTWSGPRVANFVGNGVNAKIVLKTFASGGPCEHMVHCKFLIRITIIIIWLNDFNPLCAGCKNVYIQNDGLVKHSNCIHHLVQRNCTKKKFPNQKCMCHILQRSWIFINSNMLKWYNGLIVCKFISKFVNYNDKNQQ